MKYQSGVLKEFPNQIEYARKAYKKHGVSANDIDNIVICGLGGSGIAGQIIKNYFVDKAAKPIHVVSDYDVPAYVNNKSLVILSSYSGNTEETLSMYQQALTRKAKILILSSGGKLSELAEKNNQPIYKALPNHQPRMALGFSLTYLLLIVSEIFRLKLDSDFDKAQNQLKNWETYLAKADLIFEAFKGSLENKTVIVCDNFMEAVGTRAAQQIQENAKNEAFVNILPEANHNVLETLHQKLPANFILINSGKNERNNLRFEFLSKALKAQNNVVYSMPITGSSLFAVMETIYTLDWLSLRIADTLNRESENVPIITELKQYLQRF